MKYQLTPFFKIEDEKYWILSDEISSLYNEEIEEIIEDFQNLFSDKYHESSFSGAVVSTVKMKKDLATVWYHDKETGSIPSENLFLMLKELIKSRS